MVRTAILDIDGTLVDTNYQHAVAWYRAFRQNEIVLPVWRIHRHIGFAATARREGESTHAQCGFACHRARSS